MKSSSGTCYSSQQSLPGIDITGYTPPSQGESEGRKLTILGWHVLTSYLDLGITGAKYVKTIKENILK